jgi:hypothetical protein
MHQSPIIHPRQPARPAAQKQCTMRDARTQHAAHRRYYPIPSPSSPSPWEWAVGSCVCVYRIPVYRIPGHLPGLPGPQPQLFTSPRPNGVFYQPRAGRQHPPAPACSGRPGARGGRNLGCSCRLVRPGPRDKSEVRGRAGARATGASYVSCRLVYKYKARLRSPTGDWREALASERTP